MGYRNLQEFITRLEQAGELVRIQEPVSPYLTITEITDRVSKTGGPALLFENVPGYDLPVLMNAFGSMRRMCLALEVESLDDIAAASFGMTPARILAYFRRLNYALDPEHEEGLAAFFNYLYNLGELDEMPHLEYFGGERLAGLTANC